jgi:FkbM family methyltransferase
MIACEPTMGSWIQRVRDVAGRNRPSRKPQLWEDPLLALRRRVTFEVNRRKDGGWLDQPTVVALSEAGFADNGAAPRMAVVPRETINQSLFLYGSFEISETRLIQALLRPGMTFVDVGANIGYYTVIGARLVGPIGQVHCFEPHRGIRAKLQENIARNDFRNVVVHGEAMAESTGSVAFFASAVDQNQGISSIIPGAGRQASEAVPSVSLDDFVAGLAPRRRIDLIKMDIEGAELQVIGGGRRTLAAADAPAIIFEADELAPVADALRAFGYRIKRHHYTLTRGLELHDPDADFDDIFRAYEAPNYFAAKNDGVFQAALDVANRTRSSVLRLLGRI